MKINSVLIANRGEIALRIMRTLKKIQIRSISLYTDMESEDFHVSESDDSFCLGSGTLEETWLNIPLIIHAAIQKGTDAIHPGYGFLSENAQFAKACEEAGIIFIGPKSEVIKNMGSKTVSAQFAKKAGLPLLPRLEGSHKDLINNGSSLGFPLLVKATAGGGGKGMIKVETPDLLEQAVYTAAAQSKRYFANDEVYLEKYIQSPRHLEVQILADACGNTLHLMERECTLQRNHQKVVEEAPSPSISTELRQKLLKSATDLAQAVDYTNAGTVEFIMDEEKNFYFLEMNTRIQVEHPVTEMITGIDLVEQQIYIAEGKELEIKQSDITASGHAIEARLYAEDPANSFLPSAGKIHKLHVPEGKTIRVDSAINGSGKVHPSFDAMISKIIVHDSSRELAVSKITKTLEKTLVHGVRSNIGLLLSIVKDGLYINNKLNTHTIADNLIRWTKDRSDQELMPVIAALFMWLLRYSEKENRKAWRMAGHESVRINGTDLPLFYNPMGNQGIHMRLMDQQYLLENISVKGDIITALWNNNPVSAAFSLSDQNCMFLIDGIHYQAILPETIPVPKLKVNGSAFRILDLKASLFGRVLKINVAEKQRVNAGEPLLVLESMKMENTILAPGDSIISKVNVKEGDQVMDGQTLICFEA